MYPHPMTAKLVSTWSAETAIALDALVGDFAGAIVVVLDGMSGMLGADMFWLIGAIQGKSVTGVTFSNELQLVELSSTRDTINMGGSDELVDSTIVPVMVACNPFACVPLQIPQEPTSLANAMDWFAPDSSKWNERQYISEPPCGSDRTSYPLATHVGTSIRHETECFSGFFKLTTVGSSIRTPFVMHHRSIMYPVMQTSSWADTRCVTAPTIHKPTIHLKEEIIIIAQLQTEKWYLSLVLRLQVIVSVQEK